MTDRAFTLLFFGVINLFDIAMIVLTYYTGEVGGLAVMIPISIMIAIVSVNVIWEEFSCSMMKTRKEVEKHL